MSDDFARDILRRNIAQICQTIGWNAINSTPIDVLVHVLEKYILSLGTQAHRYAEQFNRTEPNLRDLGLVFNDMNVRLPELREYTKCVPPVSCPLGVSPFPVPRESHLNFLKPGSHEVLTRPVHVHEYLPPMYPEKEKDASPSVADTVEITQNGHINLEQNCKSPDSLANDSSDKIRDVFKRPIDPGPLTPSAFKKPRLKLEEEDCHTREISSVMMTMSGFLSPAREGKLPEARIPVLSSENHADRSKNLHSSPLSSRSHLLPDRIDKKMKKLKSLNGKIDKGKRKDKSHKKLNLDAKMDKVALHIARSKERALNATKAPVLAPMPPPPIILPQSTKPVHNSLPSRIPDEIKADIPPEPIRTEITLPAPPPPPPIPIKIEEEKLPVPEEKLTLQPDRSKLNIFKKISTKVKDDKPANDNCFSDKSNYHEMNSNKLDKHNATEHVRKPKTHHVRKEFGDPVESLLAVDLSARKPRAVTPNEILDLTEDAPNNNRREFKHQNDDLPRDLTKPKLYPLPPNRMVGVGQPAKPVKKERKRKERKEKPNKATREYEKLLKRQELAQAKVDFAYSQRDGKKDTKLPAGFPFFPLNPSLMPGRGLMSGPGLIPSPGLIPNAGLFTGLANNPALRGMMQPEASGLLPNPFSFPGGFLPGGPGMMGGFSAGFGQPPRIPSQPHLPPMLRRPSLEVIPIDDDPKPPHRIHQQQQTPPVSHHPVVKHKNEKPKMPPTEITIRNHVKSPKSSPAPPKQPQQQSQNPHIKVSPVRPDVTIEVSPSPRVEKPQPPPPPPVVLPPSIRPPSPVPEVTATISEPPVEKEKLKPEKKKDKLHKKERKDKEPKIKKKKEKREKSREDKKRDKEEKQESKERTKKEKKEKRKDKEKPPSVIAEGLVPKLTLKLGSNSPLPPNSPDLPRKLNIKPIVKKDEPEAIEAPTEPEEAPEVPERSHSPELARISALVTRPPKIKSAPKIADVDVLTATTPSAQTSVPPVAARKTKPPSSISKYKRILFKPIPKRGGAGFDDTIMDDLDSLKGAAATPTAADKAPNLPVGTPYYTDEHGNKVWICPACAKPDNGTPMIGCDGCDCWYHWVCVGIEADPGDAVDWYCKSCVAKRAAMMTAMSTPLQMGKKRGRKPKMERT